MSRSVVWYIPLKYFLPLILLCYCIPSLAAGDTLTLQQRSILADYSRSDQSVQYCLAMAKQGNQDAIRALQLISAMEVYKNNTKRKQLYSELEYLNQRAQQSNTTVTEDEFKRIFVHLMADANRYKNIVSAGRKAMHWCKRGQITSQRVRK